MRLQLQRRSPTTHKSTAHFPWWDALWDADKLDPEGDKWRDQEKAKYQKRFNASSDENEVGTCMHCAE